MPNADVGLQCNHALGFSLVFTELGECRPKQRRVVPKRLWRIIQRSDTWIGRAEASLVSAGIIAVFVNSMSNVIGRYVFSRSIYFSEELNQFLVLMVTFIGTGYAVRHGRHIRMTAIYDMFPPRSRKRLLVSILTAMSALMAFFAYLSVGYVVDVAESGRVSPALRLPYFYVYLFVPIGFSFASFAYALSVISNLMSNERYISPTMLDEPECLSATGESGAPAEHL